MIKVKVTEEFTLGKFNELKNIERASKDEKGRLFVGDTFECDKEMVDYLTGNNAYKKELVKVIEIIPDEVVKEKPVKKATKTRTTKKK